MPRKNAQNVFNYKQRHFAKGLCLDCPRPARPGKLLCEKCAEAHNKRNKINDPKLYKYRTENRLCTRCGTPLIDSEGLLCINCSNHALREAGRAKNYRRFTV